MFLSYLSSSYQFLSYLHLLTSSDLTFIFFTSSYLTFHHLTSIFLTFLRVALHIISPNYLLSSSMGELVFFVISVSVFFMNHFWFKFSLRITFCFIFLWVSFFVVCFSFPDLILFRDAYIREIMVDILFCYAKVNERLSYRQVSCAPPSHL